MTSTLSRASLSLALLAFFVVPAPALAQSRSKGEQLQSKGDYLFKLGHYYRASEHYRLALLEDPDDPQKKLAFGHALFAIGNYSYASYALRRGVSELDPKVAFRPDLGALFPSKRSFTHALRDLKRYVTYSPRDAAGLTVLGYVLHATPGESARARDMFRYLLRLDPKDRFARFFLGQKKRPAKKVRAKRAPKTRHRVIFLNGFTRMDAKRVLSALSQDTEFRSVRNAGGNRSRAVIEARFLAKDMRVSLRRVLVGLDLGFTFREASLPHHLEVHFVAPPTRVKPPRPLPAPRATSLPKARPKPKKGSAAALLRTIPKPKRQGERLENAWPAPLPARSR